MNQNELLYQMIFKRKSFHIFKDIMNISAEELNEIKEVYPTFRQLDATIKTELSIVSSAETTCKRGQEYCILLYSEKKDNYLQNIGYLGVQLDLYLASKNIGALWFGIGRVEEIWSGEYYRDIGNIVRFAPSACNTQPWKVAAEDNKLTVYRYKKPGKRGIMPADKVAYYNRIDIGIFLCFLEVCLNQNGVEFERTLFIDEVQEDEEETLVAEYRMVK